MAMVRTAWTNKNFGRRYCKGASEVLGLGSLAEVNVSNENKTNSTLEAFPIHQKKAEVEADTNIDNQSQMEKNEEVKKADLELYKMEMVTKMEKLLKESQKREEKYFKILVGTWAVIGCLLLMMLKFT